MTSVMFAAESRALIVLYAVSGPYRSSASNQPPTMSIGLRIPVSTGGTARDCQYVS